MIRIQDSRFKIQKLYLFAFISLLFAIHIFSFVITPVYGQEATSAAKNNESTNSAILTKIEDLKKEIASKAADLKNEIDKRTQNKALIGKASVITTDSMTLDTKNGFKTIRLNEYTLYQNTSSQKTKKAFTKDDIKTDDNIVCLGDIDEKGIMTAKKVVKIDPIPSRKRAFTLGVINESDGKSLTITLKDGSHKTFQNDPKVVVRNGKDEGSIADIKPNSKAIIMTNDSDTITFVYISPGTELNKTSASAKESSNSAARH